MESNSTALITVEQLPVITQQFQTFSAQIDQMVEAVFSMVCNEETRISVKKERAALNKKRREIEKAYKAVRAAVMAPIYEVDSLYKSCVADKLDAADEKLKGKVMAVETEMKQQMAADVKAYYGEYAESLGLNWIPFERVGLNITLTATAKKLREQCKSFLDKVAGDISVIETMKMRDAIMAEYQQSLNLHSAIDIVNQRIVAEAQQRKAREERERRMAEEAQRRAEAAQAAQPYVKPLSAPIIEPVAPQKSAVDEDAIKEVRFTVRAPISKLRALKAFLDTGGYDYQ